MIKYISLIILSISFFGCEDAFQQVIEIDIPEHEPKLVSYCILDDIQDTFHIDVYHSAGILDDDFEKIEDAKISFSADGTNLNAAVVFDSTYYFSDWGGHWDQEKMVWVKDTLYGGAYVLPNFDIAKQIIEIEIEQGQYPKTTASSIVPPKPSITKIEYSGIVDTINETNGSVEVWFDGINPDFFYMVAITKEGLMYNDTYGETSLNIDSKDPRFRVHYLYANLGFPDGFLLFEGKDFEKSFTKRFGFRDWSDSHTDDKYFVKLIALSKDVYNYLNAVIVYNQADGNPFAEPVVIPTNFDNGYGIFGVTRTVKKEF